MKRPAPDPLKGAEIFQQYARPAPPVYRSGERVRLCIVKASVESQLTGTGWRFPTVEFYGVTAQKNSICVCLEGFLPHFFVHVPHGVSHEILAGFCQLLNWYMDTKPALRRRASLARNQPMVVGCDVINNGCQSIMGYRPPTDTMCLLRIDMAEQSLVRPACNAISRGLILPSLGPGVLKTYEGHINYLTRVMVDLGIYGFQWIDVDIPPFAHGGSGGGAVSRCQLEYHVTRDAIHPVPIDAGPGGDVPPLRILHIDIECPAQPNAKGARFPEAKLDAITHISAVLTEMGAKQPIVSMVLAVVPNADAHVGHLGHTVVVELSSEREMLQTTFPELVRVMDPDVIATYNGEAFDFPYIIDRGYAIGLDGNQVDFSRRRGNAVAYKKTTFDSRAYGRKDSCHTEIIGRVNFDLLQYFFREFKLRSYNLGATSMHFLGQTKEDAHHSILYSLQHGSDADRARLASYCEKDSRLVWLMMEKTAALFSYIEICRVTGVQMETVLLKGQSSKAVSLILRYGRPRNIYVPTIVGKRIAYQGARVVDPQSGWYDSPVSTLDFNSLYPSIMIALNLCYTTHLFLANLAKTGLTPAQYELPKHIEDLKPGEEFAFVQADTKKGLLPLMLETILAQRRACQAQLKAETDPTRKKVLDKRQIALKLTANSIYGFTSAFALPLTDIARATTAMGRFMIGWSIQLVEAKYPGAKVIYGDTDSIMILWGPGTTVEQAFQLGQEASAYCTSHFKPPLKLAFECVYFPMLLLKKKKYAAGKYLVPHVMDCVQEKGIESVRRDWTLCCTDGMSESLQILVVERDTNKCVQLVHNLCRMILQNQIPMHKLIVSKGFKKSWEDYRKQKSLPVHIALAERMFKRDPATAPKVGDRISYVLIKGLSKEYRNRGWADVKKGELAEDPLYAMEHRLTIDGQAFIAAQLVKPFVRLLNPVFCKDAKELADVDGYFENNPEKTAAYRVLFTGPHMNHRVIAPVLAGPMAGFVTRTLTCLHCKTPIATKDAVCAACDALRPAVYMRIRRETNVLERSYNAAWTTCQRCQGSFHSQVICGNRECDNFYFRDMMRIQLEDAQAKLARFIVADQEF